MDKKGENCMGVLDFLFAGKRMEEIKMVLIGKHVFENLDKSIQNEAVEVANFRLSEGTPATKRTMADLDDRVKYVFLALAMAELNIEHGIEGFQWLYVRNPFLVQTYDDKLWRATSDMLTKRYGIKVRL